MLSYKFKKDLGLLVCLCVTAAIACTVSALGAGAIALAYMIPGFVVSLLGIYFSYPMVHLGHRWYLYWNARSYTDTEPSELSIISAKAGFWLLYVTFLIFALVFFARGN